MAEQGAFPEMTPKAAEAYDAYVSLGHRRSLRLLADELVRRTLYKSSTVAFRQVTEWSSKFGWQDRLSAAVTALADERLAQAAELDAQSFLKTSEIIAERLAYTTHDNIDMVIKARETVRKPTAKTQAMTVNINLIVQELAQKYGLTDQERSELFEEMQADLNKARVGAS